MFEKVSLHDTFQMFAINYFGVMKQKESYELVSLKRWFCGKNCYNLMNFQ